MLVVQDGSHRCGWRLSPECWGAAWNGTPAFHRGQDIAWQSRRYFRFLDRTNQPRVLGAPRLAGRLLIFGLTDGKMF